MAVVSVCMVSPAISAFFAGVEEGAGSASGVESRVGRLPLEPWPGVFSGGNFKRAVVLGRTPIASSVRPRRGQTFVEPAKIPMFGPRRGLIFEKLFIENRKKPITLSLSEAR